MDPGVKRMQAEKIEKILEFIGCDKIRSDENNVHASCPMRHWRHDGGTDRSPSFGVKINPSGPSSYNCYSCKTKGTDLKILVWEWMEMTGKSLPAEMQEWLHEDYLDVIAKVNNIYDYEPDRRREDVLPEEWWSPYAGSVPRYLLDRGITLDTARAWGLGHDKRNRRLMFSIRTAQGELAGFIGRKIRERDPGPKYWTVSGIKKGRYLYGENMHVSGKVVVAVEGTMDALHVWQSGIRDVVAILGSALTKDQARTLVQWDLPVYWFLDNDNAGKRGMIEAYLKLKDRVPMYAVKYFEGYKEPTDFTGVDLEEALSTAEIMDVWVARTKREMDQARKERKAKAKESSDHFMADKMVDK